MSIFQEISDLVKDYEVERVTPDRVQYWSEQFDMKRREDVLEVTKQILTRGYVNRHKYFDYLDAIVQSEKICGRRLSEFWAGVSLLDVQKKGSSQKYLINVLSEKIKKRVGISPLVNDMNKDVLVYVDDFMFSGSRLKSDLTQLNDVLSVKKDVIVIYMGTYSSALWQCVKKWEKGWGNLNVLQIYRLKNLVLEDRLAHKNYSDKFWMHSDALSSEVLLSYIQNYTQFRRETMRSYHGEAKFFPEPGKRFSAEIELCEKGIQIINAHEEVGYFFKPMGFDGYEGFGFGGALTSYRNCPNNLPLAYWWSLGGWFPLLKRIGNG